MEKYTCLINNENKVFIDDIASLETLLLQSIVAGRNSNGCKIYIGWTLEKNESYFAGLKDIEETKRYLETLLQKDPRFSYHQFLYRDLEIHQEGKRLGIVLNIAEAPLEEKPVTVNGLSYYFLNGAIESLNDTLINRLRPFADPYGQDLTLLPDFTRDDLDETSIAHFRQSFLQKFPKTKDLSTTNFLTQIRALSPEGNVTTAGLLFFGKKEAFDRHFPQLSFYLYENKGGESKLSLPESGTFQGLYSFYTFALKRAESYYGNAIKSRFHRGFLYATTQCDFLASDPIVLTLFENQYSFSIAGCPLVYPTSPLRPSFHPILRNYLLLLDSFLDDETTSLTQFNAVSQRLEITSKVKEKAKPKPIKETSIKKKSKKEDLSFAKEIEGLFREELCREIAAFKAETKDQIFGRTEFLSATGVSPATGTACLKKLQQAKKIRPVKGQGKGKFRFR